MNPVARLVVSVCIFALAGLVASCEPGKKDSTPKVFFTRPTVELIQQELEFTGDTEAVKRAEVRAAVGGVIEGIHFQFGKQVKKGAALFTLDAKQFQEKLEKTDAELKQKQAELQLKEVELRKLEQTTENRTQIKLDQAGAELAKARADVEAVEAELKKARSDMESVRITSPIDGRMLTEDDVHPGMQTKPGTRLAYIVDYDSAVYVYLDVDERDFLAMRKMDGVAAGSGEEARDGAQESEAKTDAAPSRVSAFLQLAGEAGFDHQGYIDFGAAAYKGKDRRFRVRAVFADPNGLLSPGLKVRVRVPIEKREAVFIPELALKKDASGALSVMVVNQDNIVEQRAVELGKLEGKMRLIKEGLTKDQRVITRGAETIREGAMVRAKPDPTNYARGLSANPQEKSVIPGS